MGNIQYRDSNRELVMKLAQIHRDGKDAAKECEALGVKFENPANICWECHRKVIQGGIERAVQLVKMARLDNKPGGRDRIPSHEAARRREEAADNKTSFDEEAGNEYIERLEHDLVAAEKDADRTQAKLDGATARINELQEATARLEQELDGALAKIGELQNAEAVIPEVVDRKFLAKVLKAAEPGLLDQVPHLGGERIGDIQDWATSILE